MNHSFDVDEKNEFVLVMSHEATQSGIKFIDFSTDNYYLLFVDNFGDTNIVDLTTKSQLRSTQNMEFTNEWTSEGIQISDKTKVNVLRRIRIK